MSAHSHIRNAALTQEPIGRTLLRLALPILASQALRIGYQWVDALWVRGLGVSATAAVTSSLFVMWSLYSLNDVIAIGIVAYVSQLLGAGDRERAGKAAYIGVRASAVMGVVCAVLGILAARTIYGWMAKDPAVLRDGASYLRAVLVGGPFIMVSLTGESIMRSAGDSRTPLFVDLGAITLNALLDPFLIYGWGPFPRLGVAGAAWATVIAQAVMAITYVTLAVRGHPAFPFSRSAGGRTVKTTGVLRVGAPAAIIGMLFSVVYIVFASSASRFGPASMAIIGIANRIEAVSYLVAVAIGLAAATIVGQNLGAGQPERAEKVIRIGIRWLLWFSLVLMTIMLTVPNVFISLFTPDPEVHRVGATYIRILSLCLSFNVVEIVVAESVLASGHTLPISIIFCTFSLLRLPLAYLVPDWTGWKVWGIAAVISGTCVLRCLCIVAWASRGTWKTGLHVELGASPAAAAADLASSAGPG
ncbi:MAG TPA: MATE family efflux transporter [Candidatus Eisenbacteria bacterium]|nr:MATE family efflux transporter [Candidatus Eisenbacteria bacterium]